jgi:signal transduction histidine kinase/DNA-binding response OmpR family regulator/CHASE3 domain sensor protein
MKSNKILPFEALVISLLFLILVFVGVMGSYTFKRLNVIVETISNQSKPDNRLGIMKDILNDLYRSEISVKSYRLTKDNNYLMEFYLSAKTINKRIEQLHEFDVANDTMYLATDSMSALIEQEYEILEALLKVKDEYRVKVALDKAMETVDKNITTIEKIEAATEAENLQQDSADMSQEAVEKTNFFKRIFGSSKRKKKEEETDLLMDTIAILNEIRDTVGSDSHLERINQNLAELSQKETAQEVQMNIRELRLIKKSETIMQQIRDLLIGMEIYQSKITLEKSKKIEELAHEIKNLIGLFTVTASFLILLAAAITVNYVRKNNQYKKVLRDARKKAEELAVERERFLANMSHEIRTPMNAIIGYTEQLLHSDLKENQREQLDIVRKAGNHLIQIINEVLDFSTMQAGKTVLNKVSFLPHEIISDVVQLMQQSAEKKKLKLNYFPNTESVFVAGDPGRFRQILLNLLSNAIKYTDEGEVTITTSQKIIDNRRIQLTVLISDTGVGMSSDFLNKVFEEFERADIVVDKTESGSGLGLAITKKLIDIHRGRITFKSTKGEGTAVKVVLPYQISQSTEKENLHVNSRSKKIGNLRFLVVDDVEYNRKLLGAILKRNDAYYKEAKNGQEAIDILNREHFDIILMDIRMPLIDGITATKVIKKTDEKVQIIALTASTSEKEKEKYFKAGIERILLKPISERELLTAIYELSDGIAYVSDEKIVENQDKFNLDELWKLCQYDKTFFDEMLDTFIKTSKDTLELLKTALKEQDMKQISFLAHRLSGPTKHIGAVKLFEYLKDLEFNSEKNYSLESLNKLMLNTEEEIGEIIQFISSSRHKY